MKTQTVTVDRTKLEQWEYALWVCSEHNALHHGDKHNTVMQSREAITAIKEALAQSEQESVGKAYLCDRCHTPFDGAYECPSCGHNEATKESVYTAPPQRKPLTDEHTTFVQRFTDAVAILCGSEPPAEFVDEWLRNVDVNGIHRLQEWVLNQDATPPWSQGIVVLDAAYLLAESPAEGLQHEAAHGIKE